MKAGFSQVCLRMPKVAEGKPVLEEGVLAIYGQRKQGRAKKEGLLGFI